MENLKKYKIALDAWERGGVTSDDELKTCIEALEIALVVVNKMESHGIVTRAFQIMQNSMLNVQRLRNRKNS